MTEVEVELLREFVQGNTHTYSSRQEVIWAFLCSGFEGHGCWGNYRLMRLVSCMTHGSGCSDSISSLTLKFWAAMRLARPKIYYHKINKSADPTWRETRVGRRRRKRRNWVKVLMQCTYYKSLYYWYPSIWSPKS